MRLGIIVVVSMLLINCKEQKQSHQSTDEKQFVEVVQTPSKSNSSLPHLFSNESKTLLSWVEIEGDSLTKFLYAEWAAEKWHEPKEILRGTDWFVNWADYPMIAENKGNLWSHILKKSTADTYSYDVKMNVLQQGQEVWKTNLALHTDGTFTEHGFVTVLPYKDAFFVTWLDGRNTLENEAGERGTMTIRAAEVNADGSTNAASELDVSACDCCQTTAAITDNGPVVIYRDRTEEEVRDINIVRKVEGEWTKSKPIHSDHWKIKGCPVNGPKAAALNNTLVAAWFTEAQENPRVQLIFSADGGANFDAPIQIAEGNVLGRVDVLLIDINTAIVSWMETKDQITHFKAVRVSRKAKIGSPHIITNLSASRKTGFPQMELVENKVLFAWTNLSNESTTVQSASMAVLDF